MKKTPEGTSKRENLRSRRKTARTEQVEYPRTDWPHWRRIGGPPPPDPERCTPEEGRDYYGIHYDLWKLGVPLDLKLPALEDTQTAKEREYERRTYQPLIKKTREAAAKFSKLLTRLDAAQRNHPTEEIRLQQHIWASASATVTDKAEPPLEKSFDARQIGRALGCDRLCRECLRVVGTIRPRKKGDRSKTEDVLAAAGLGPTQIARVTTLLGMEAPAATIEEIAERVRKRLERKRANRT